MAWVVPVVAGLASLYKTYQDSKNNDKVAAAGQEKLRNLKEATAILEQQRQARFQNGMNALSNQTGAFQGAANVLASMYGPRGSVVPNLSLDKGAPRMAGGGPAPTSGGANGMNELAKLFGKGGAQSGLPTGSGLPAAGVGGPGLAGLTPTPSSGGPLAPTGPLFGSGKPPIQPTPASPSIATPISLQRAGTPMGGLATNPSYGLNAVSKLYGAGGGGVNPGGGSTPIIFNPGGSLV